MLGLNSYTVHTIWWITYLLKKSFDFSWMHVYSSSVLCISPIWQVVLSDGFRKSFIGLKSPQLKREVLQKLVKLGGGWRTTFKNIDICDTFQLAKVYKVRDFYLIWNIDMEKKERRVFQIIRIWDLLPHKHVARTVQRLENMFSMYTDDYLDHCRRVQTDGYVLFILSWFYPSSSARSFYFCSNFWSFQMNC